MRGGGRGAIAPPGARRRARRGDSGEGGNVVALTEIPSQYSAFCAVGADRPEDVSTQLQPLPKRITEKTIVLTVHYRFLIISLSIITSSEVSTEATSLTVLPLLIEETSVREVRLLLY